MTGPTRPAPAPGAVRLIFSYRGEDVRLVHQQPVDVVVPGMDLTREERPGRFVEVRSADDARLSQVPVRVSMTNRVEVFPEDHRDPITTVELPEAMGAFTVVVPVSPRAHHVALVDRAAPEGTDDGTRSARSATPGAVVELAAFALAAPVLEEPDEEVDR